MTRLLARGLRGLSETRGRGAGLSPGCFLSLVALTVTVCNQTHAVSARPHVARGLWEEGWPLRPRL